MSAKFKVGDIVYSPSYTEGVYRRSVVSEPPEHIERPTDVLCARDPETGVIFRVFDARTGVIQGGMWGRKGYWSPVLTEEEYEEPQAALRVRKARMRIAVAYHSPKAKEDLTLLEEIVKTLDKHGY